VYFFAEGNISVANPMQGWQQTGEVLKFPLSDAPRGHGLMSATVLSFSRTG
jgi:hypothetical protein